MSNANTTAYNNKCIKILKKNTKSYRFGEIKSFEPFKRAWDFRHIFAAEGKHENYGKNKIY